MLTETSESQRPELRQQRSRDLSTPSGVVTNRASDAAANDVRILDAEEVAVAAAAAAAERMDETAAMISAAAAVRPRVVTAAADGDTAE